MTLGQVRRWGLRSGDAIVGAVRKPREGEERRVKHNALVHLESINGQSIEEASQRIEFSKLTPLYPDEQLRLETSSKVLAPRIIDLMAPIGKGQRGLIVSPPKAGKTIILQQIANAISINNPEVHIMVVLVDERPEEVTDMQRTVKGRLLPRRSTGLPQSTPQWQNSPLSGPSAWWNWAAMSWCCWIPSPGWGVLTT